MAIDFGKAGIREVALELVTIVPLRSQLDTRPRLWLSGLLPKVLLRLLLLLLMPFKPNALQSISKLPLVPWEKPFVPLLLLRRFARFVVLGIRIREDDELEEQLDELEEGESDRLL